VRYRVIVTDPVFEVLQERARYLAKESGSQEVAHRWLRRVFATGETLAENPRRCALAAENRHRSFEIRWIGIGEFLLLFTIRDQTVWIIGARHGRQRPRPSDLAEPE